MWETNTKTNGIMWDTTVKGMIWNNKEKKESIQDTLIQIHYTKIIIKVKKYQDLRTYYQRHDKNGI